MLRHVRMGAMAVVAALALALGLVALAPSAPARASGDAEHGGGHSAAVTAPIPAPAEPDFADAHATALSIRDLQAACTQSGDTGCASVCKQMHHRLMVFFRTNTGGRVPEAGQRDTNLASLNRSTWAVCRSAAVQASYTETHGYPVPATH
ncbi:hypothetical protein [Zavarzinia sp. CC-PAN008]|uniref:hypothetical protein n=1 Tax=Zavarzinia sp. CC-PAN008 TaxID=3243332 RepID=UPI003F7478EE